MIDGILNLRFNSVKFEILIFEFAGLIACTSLKSLHVNARDIQEDRKVSFADEQRIGLMMVNVALKSNITLLHLSDMRLLNVDDVQSVDCSSFGCNLEDLVLANCTIKSGKKFRTIYPGLFPVLLNAFLMHFTSEMGDNNVVKHLIERSPHIKSITITHCIAEYSTFLEVFSPLMKCEELKEINSRGCCMVMLLASVVLVSKCLKSSVDLEKVILGVRSGMTERMAVNKILLEHGA